MMTAEILPPELLTHVISYLHEEKEDRKTLSNLPLACSHFHELCRPALFSHIRLAPLEVLSADRRPPSERLLELLTSAPWVAQHVKRLTIPNNAGIASNWLPDDIKLTEALAKLDLHRIVQFSFEKTGDAPWVMFFPAAVDVILKICQSPNLVHLSFTRAPLALVGVCSPSLKHLEAMHCSPPDIEDNVTPIPRSSPITLETLRLSCSWDLHKNVRYLLDEGNQIKLNALRMLHVVAKSGYDHDEVPKLLGACKESLKTLIFEPCPFICGLNLLSLSCFMCEKYV